MITLPQERTSAESVLAAMKQLREHDANWRGGHIVSMSSLAAERPKPHVSACAASKAAVLALTRSLAQEVAGFGLPSTRSCPGT